MFTLTQIAAAIGTALIMATMVNLTMYPGTFKEKMAGVPIFAFWIVVTMAAYSMITEICPRCI